MNKGAGFESKNDLEIKRVWVADQNEEKLYTE